MSLIPTLLEFLGSIDTFTANASKGICSAYSLTRRSFGEVISLIPTLIEVLGSIDNFTALPTPVEGFAVHILSLKFWHLLGR